MIGGGIPKAVGSFIQGDLAESFGDKEWISEFKYLKEAGMNYVILGHSEKDIIGNCLRNAEVMGMKVFITINYNNLWFEKGTNEKWLYNQMEIDSAAADKVYKKYYLKHRDSFYGWYFAYETDNMNFNTRKKFKILTKALNILLNNLEEKGERLPIMLSPFMNSYYGTPKEYTDNWEYLFCNSKLKKGDIFCPQDCIGGGGLDISKLEDWFSSFRKAVNIKPGLLLWANAETFDNINWCSSPLNRFIEQMKIETKYVDNIITFSYSHYYSPNNVDSRFHKVYLNYLKTGSLPAVKPDFPRNINIRYEGINKVKISWEPAESEIGIFGYEVYRNGKLIYQTFIERKYGGLGKGLVLNYEDSGILPLKLRVYEVKAVDFAGNKS
ncbi:MAG: DUF4434 domain-containing protein [Solirubrobacterales bacterium]